MGRSSYREYSNPNSPLQRRNSHDCSDHLIGVEFRNGDGEKRP